MGLMEELGGMLGGQNEVQRMANGQGNFDDPNSPDHDRLGKMLGHATPDDLQSALSQATQQTDPGEFADHVTPGVNGTNPLGEVGQGGLSTIASALVSQLGTDAPQGAGGDASAGGGQGFLGGLLGGGNRGGGGGGAGGILGSILGGGAGGGLGGLLGGGNRGGGGGAMGGGGGAIPGVRTLDPNQMDESQVAALAEWMRRNHPDAFNRAAAQVGQQNPSLLSKLLNNKMLMIAAAGLAAKIFMNRRQQQ